MLVRYVNKNGWNQPKLKLLGDLILYLHITAQCCLYTTPESIRKPLGFLMFSGDIDKQQLTVMGSSLCVRIDKTLKMAIAKSH